MSNPLYQMSASWGLGWGFLQRKLWQFCLERERGREPITQIHKKLVYKNNFPDVECFSISFSLPCSHTPKSLPGVCESKPLATASEKASQSFVGSMGGVFPARGAGEGLRLRSHHLETSMNSPIQPNGSTFYVRQKTQKPQKTNKIAHTEALTKNWNTNNTLGKNICNTWQITDFQTVKALLQISRRPSAQRLMGHDTNIAHS